MNRPVGLSTSYNMAYRAKGQRSTLRALGQRSKVAKCPRWAKGAYSVFRYSVGAISNLCNRKSSNDRRSNVKSPTGLVRGYFVYRYCGLRITKSSEWPALWVLPHPTSHSLPFRHWNVVRLSLYTSYELRNRNPRIKGAARYSRTPHRRTHRPKSSGSSPAFAGALWKNSTGQMSIFLRNESSSPATTEKTNAATG